MFFLNSTKAAELWEARFGRLATPFSLARLLVLLAAKNHYSRHVLPSGKE